MGRVFFRFVTVILPSGASRTPSIDSINRAVRNITVAVTEKTYELDELTLRLNRIKLQPTMSSPLNRSRR